MMKPHFKASDRDINVIYCTQCIYNPWMFDICTVEPFDVCYMHCGLCVCVCYLVILENASFRFFLNPLLERT